MKTASLVLFCTAAFGQNSYKPPRTSYGQPDLQGVWDFRTITPLERSKGLGTKAFFTAEEAAKYEQEENRRQNRDLIDPKQGGSQYPPGGTHLIERFTRGGENTLLYEFTVDDPSTWTRPWSAAIEMWKSEGLIYEYACHEANYAMEGILSGARKREAQTAK